MRGFVLAFGGWLLLTNAPSAQVGGGVVSDTVSSVGVPIGGDALGAGQPPRDTRPSATGTASLRGRIVDAESGTPLRRAIVRIASPEIRESRSRISDADGRYAFDNLPAGRYFLSASKAGYVDWSHGQLRAFEPGKAVPLADKEALDRADIALPHGAVITGRVVDEYGEPVPDVQVSPLRNQFTPGGRRPVPSGRGGQTNDIGEFRLFGLSPGDYLVTAAQQRFTMALNDTSDDRSGYAPTYYPSTANAGDAQTIRVVAGQVVSGLTLSLVPTRTATVSGVVVDGEGRPLRGGSVIAMQQNGTMSFGGQGGQVRPDGSFTIPGLSPGTYLLRSAMPPTSPSSGSPTMATAVVTVNGEDLTGVRLEPVVPVTISGHVVLDPPGAPGIRPQMVRFTATRSNPFDGMGVPIPPPEAVHDDWTFAIKAIPGQSTVRSAGIPAGWMIRRVRLLGEDVTDGLEIGKNDIDGLEIELTNRVPQVTGRVTNSRGEAVAEFVAVAFPQDPESWSTSGPGRSAVGRPDDQGRFTIRTLRPGDYYLAVVEHVENGQWLDPEFLESLRSSATRVTLTEGETKTLDLKLADAR